MMQCMRYESAMPCKTIGILLYKRDILLITFPFIIIKLSTRKFIT
jgi:hypothetical protein